MANELSGQPRQVAPWHGRPVILLNERYGRERLIHGIVIGPQGVSCAEALRRVDAAFRAAVVSDTEEWTYDDVLNRVKAAGFQEILAAEWWESHVELNDD